jgi:hypothetical protein
MALLTVLAIFSFGIYLAVPLAIKAGERYPEKKYLPRHRRLEGMDNDNKNEKPAAWME